MYRVIKVLSNNGVVVMDVDNHQECILWGKGIGFGKVPNERFEENGKAKVYILSQAGARKESLNIINSVSPIFIEIANRLLILAEDKWGEIDTSILLPMADHIACAVKRIEDGVEIRNPFTNEIKALFPEEYKLALKGQEYIRQLLDREINEDEVGYITLHINAAKTGERVEQAMQEAMLTSRYIAILEEALAISVDIDSLAYNRFASHVRYMLARASRGEDLTLDMNDYARERFPRSYKLAQQLCQYLATDIKKQIPEVEIGYLALHIQRVWDSVK